MPIPLIRPLRVISLLAVSGISARAADDEDVTPETIEGVTIVDAEGLIGKVAGTPGLVLIDARIPSDRGEGDVGGSTACRIA